MFLTLMVVCDLTMWSNIYSPPWRSWHEMYQTRSEAACLNLGKDLGARGVHSVTYDLPRDKIFFEGRCGPDGADCPAK